MEDRLITILQQFGFPVFRQGSMNNEDGYPENFFTFWNNESTDHAHYSNDEYGVTWNFDVNFYSSDPVSTYEYLEKARLALKSDGWIITGRGYDVASDEASHTGRGMNALYLET